MSDFQLSKIQEILREFKIQAWLLYDFKGINTLAREILRLSPETHITRRIFYLLPANGEPVKIVSAIEAFVLDHLPGKTMLYASRESLVQALETSLKEYDEVAMEYSPFNNIPYVSKIDAGTYELIKSLNKTIISSGDLIAALNARWTEEQYEDNKKTSTLLYEIVEKSFAYIKEKIVSNSKTDEYEIQQFIMREFASENLITDHPPIVAVEENSANPHYCPTKEHYKEITKNQLVLIDLWAKANKPNGTFSDITWVCYAGETAPDKYHNVANIVFSARDAAYNLLKERLENNQIIRGYELDDAARNVIKKAGYGEYFLHRLGHSITTETHGSGAHLDNFETKDERRILPMTSFSIEPGIYLKNQFGIRSEIDVFITRDNKPIQTGKERQKHIICLF